MIVMIIITQMVIIGGSIVSFLLIYNFIVSLHCKVTVPEDGSEAYYYDDGVDMAIAKIHTAVLAVPLFMGAALAVMKLDYDFSSVMIRHSLRTIVFCTIGAIIVGAILQTIFIALEKEQE